MIDNPYTNAEASALPQNELEARALVRTASRLNNIKEKWPVATAELNEALDLNRKLWTILVTGATEEANPLPIEIKQNIFIVVQQPGLFENDQIISFPDLIIIPDRITLIAILIYYIIVKDDLINLIHILIYRT